MPEFVIRCVESASGGRAPSGLYLSSYDPDWRPSRAVRRANGYPEHQTGKADWTADLAEAMKFPDAKAAWDCYVQGSSVVPVRPDGQPNRPLTAYTVEVIPAEDAS